MVWPSPPDPPKYIINPETGKRLEIVILTPIDEIQLQHTLKLKDILREFESVELEVLQSDFESQKRGVLFLRKRDCLREAMSVFDSSLSIKFKEIASYELFILLAASSFWSVSATEEVKKELLERFQNPCYDPQITEKNYKVFFNHFCWKELTDDQRKAIIHRTDKSLFSEQWFQVMLDDYAFTLEFLDVSCLLNLLREDLSSELAEAVKSSLRLRFEARVQMTGGINRSNYLLFKKYFVMDDKLESKIRLECFFSEECRNNWDLFKDEARALRVLRTTLSEFDSAELNEEFKWIVNTNSVALTRLSLLCYRDDQLSKKVSRHLREPTSFKRNLDLFKDADRLADEVNNVERNNPSGSLGFLITHVNEFVRTIKNEPNYSPILGKGLNQEYSCILARILACHEIACFAKTYDLERTYKLFETLLRMVSQLSDVKQNETIEKIVAYLLSYVHEYPHPTLHDPLLAGDLRNPAKVAAFVEVLRSDKEYMDVAKSIFKIPLDTPEFVLDKKI